MSSPVQSIDALLDCVQCLLEDVSLDNNGAMVGGRWQGGHGGLYRPETLRSADALRRAVTSFREKPPSAAAQLNLSTEPL